MRDDGRGIPVGIQSQTGLPAVTVVFTILHAGGKFFSAQVAHLDSYACIQECLLPQTGQQRIKMVNGRILKDQRVCLEIAMQYNDSYNELLLSFANNIHTTDGGTHEDGFKFALTRVLNDYARKNNILKESDKNLPGREAVSSADLRRAILRAFCAASRARAALIDFSRIARGC